LLALSDLVAEVNLTASSDRIDLLLSGEEPSRLIGRHGQTLDALQTLVGSITDRLTTVRSPINLDVDGYRIRRRDYLRSTARRMAQKVRQSGKPATTPPLSQYERRYIHGIFKQEPGLRSHSKDHEGGRKIVVLQRQD
jgi:spoIIIJ-associated protein